MITQLLTIVIDIDFELLTRMIISEFDKWSDRLTSNVEAEAGSRCAGSDNLGSRNKIHKRILEAEVKAMKIYHFH